MNHNTRDPVVVISGMGTPIRNNWRAVVFVMLLLSVACAINSQVFAESIRLTIETRIKNKTLSLQAGMKSTQTIDVNYDTRKVSDVFQTGVTDIGVAQLKSVRDKFVIRDAQFSGKVAAFTAEGETASGVLIMPNINYKFSITVDSAAREIVFSGCHDGYPSYKITVQGKEIYSFEQGILVALLGSCDIDVPHTTRKF